MILYMSAVRDGGPYDRSRRITRLTYYITSGISASLRPAHHSTLPGFKLFSHISHFASSIYACIETVFRSTLPTL